MLCWGTLHNGGKVRSIVLTCAAILAVSSTSYAYNSDYPKTREEKRAEEAGSILGGEGLVFHPKVRNESTKTESSTNTYLWNAALEVLSMAPLMIKDEHSGTIVTDWYSASKSPNESDKVTVTILGDVIAPESLNVQYVRRVLKNGRWLESDVKPETLMDIEMRIINRARELYIKASPKK